MKISEVADLMGVSKQAIYITVKNKRLKACKIKSNWDIDYNDVLVYIKTRFSREHSKKDGEYVYDTSQGRINISQASEIIGVNKQKAYYLARNGNIPHTRNGSMYVFDKKEVEKLSGKFSKRKLKNDIQKD